MARFVHIVDRTNMWITKITAFLVLPNAGVLLYGVIMRYVFNRPISWEGDIGWLIFVSYSLLAGAYVLHRGGHVRLDLLYGRFSPRRKAIMDVATFVFFLLFIGTLTWFTIGKAWWSVSVIERNAHSSFHGPIYPARISLALGCVLLLFQGIAEFIGNILAVMGHNIDGRIE